MRRSSAVFLLLLLEVLFAMMLVWVFYTHLEQKDYFGASLAAIASIAIVYYLYNFALYARMVRDKVALTRAIRNSNVRDVKTSMEAVLYRTAVVRIALACFFAYGSKTAFEEGRRTEAVLMGGLAAFLVVEGAAFLSAREKSRSVHSNKSRAIIKSTLSMYQTRFKRTKTRKLMSL